MRKPVALDRLAAPPSARPFLKWAGGKRKLLPQLLLHVPDAFRTPGAKTGRYFEPFIGGGALFFEVRPRKALLTDVNERLIRTYTGVRDRVADVIGLLRDEYRHDEEFFYERRKVDIDRRTDAEVAAWFIYMNKTAFNGLYRVNSRDRFNVPFGRYENPNFCDETTLRACSEALMDAELRVMDFEVAVAKAKPRDFVYFDPPYVPLSATSSFTSYTKRGFGEDAQTRLRDVARKLKKRGVNILLSNSSAAENLYKKNGFKIITVSATRSVNSQGDGRGAVKELVIT